MWQDLQALKVPKETQAQQEPQAVYLGLQDHKELQGLQDLEVHEAQLDLPEIKGKPDLPVTLVIQVIRGQQDLLDRLDRQVV